MYICKIKSVYLTLFAAEVCALCMLSVTVNAETNPDQMEHKISTRILPPPPGPFVTQNRAAMHAPQNFVGSYRPMNMLTTDDMKQNSVENVWSRGANYYTGPSSSDLYGKSIFRPQTMTPKDTQVVITNERESKPGAQGFYQGMPARSSNEPYSTQPVPGTYGAQQPPHGIGSNAADRYRNNQKQFPGFEVTD